LNVGLSAFEKAIFHVPIILDQVAQWSTFQNACARFSTSSRPQAQTWCPNTSAERVEPL
jgi:hypothetical protein